MFHISNLNHPSLLFIFVYSAILFLYYMTTIQMTQSKQTTFDLAVKHGHIRVCKLLIAAFTDTAMADDVSTSHG